MTSSSTSHAAKKAITDRDIRPIRRNLRATHRQRDLPEWSLDKLAIIVFTSDDLLYRPASGARNLLFHLRTVYFQHVRSEGVLTSNAFSGVMDFNEIIKSSRAGSLYRTIVYRALNVRNSADNIRLWILYLGRKHFLAVLAADLILAALICSKKLSDRWNY